MLRRFGPSHLLAKWRQLHNQIDMSDLRDIFQDAENSQETQRLKLPTEFIFLGGSNLPFEARQALRYLLKRGITTEDIHFYKLGFCSEGEYRNRIIIPSYDEDGKLNYFIARDIFPNSRFKYKNPPMSKDTVVFELFINWNEPIVLVEGSFDAIAVRKNVIPLLGKFPSKSLVKKLVTKRVKKVYVALDTDAKKDAAKLVKFLMDSGIEAYLLSMKEKDPSELGFEEFWNRVKQTEQSTFSDIIRGKLYG